MNAICFACGHEKPEPLILCSQCGVKPISDKDKISSVCLSDHCFDADKLLRASRYIRRKRKLPKFGEKAIARSKTFVDSLKRPEENYTLIDVDDSFFDFDGFDSDKGETIKVHSIGKPPASTDGVEPIGIGFGQEKTYHILDWELGREISFEEAESRADATGELYIQYTWRGDQGWIWKFVTKDQFEQLKMLEEIGK